MFKKLTLAVTTAVLTLAGAGMSYRLTLFEPGNVNGSQLKPGEYKLELRGDKATLSHGKVKAEANVEVKSEDKTAPATVVKYVNGQIAEIKLGGTKTKLVFPTSPATQGVSAAN